jgi:hypothetical protein
LRLETSSTKGLGDRRGDKAKVANQLIVPMIRSIMQTLPTLFEDGA